MVTKKTSKKTSVKTTSSIVPKEYAKTLTQIKKRIQESQIKASFAANKELLLLYWFIGRTIVEKQEQEGWGTSVLERLAKDLQNAFPGISGFSRANIFRMQALYRAYEKVSVPPRQLQELPIFNIPWWHNVVLLTKTKDTQQRLWYAQQAIAHGWSSTVLEMHIESGLHTRKGKAITNFKYTLVDPHSDMAQQTLKDPYVFDFLDLDNLALEKQIEQGLIDHIQKFLLELGEGFAFIGKQYHIAVGDSDFYIDLLFYHLNLQCYIVVELKTTKFEPEYAGKLNFYLSAVDTKLRKPTDAPTIGLLLCKTKDNFVAEYALRDINKPMGVAGYTTKITKELPKVLAKNLPTVKEIEAELAQPKKNEKKKKTPRKATKKS